VRITCVPRIGSSQNRTPRFWTSAPYGAHAQRLLPHLRETAALFEKGMDFKRLSEQAQAVRAPSRGSRRHRTGLTCGG
jgi:hypothetical protein